MPIIFFVLIIYLLWRTVQFMPRVKPQPIDTSSPGTVAWDDVAGVDEAKAELQEVVDFLREPEAVRAPRRARAQGDAALRPARHRQDAAREGRRERVGRQLLLASASAFVEMFAGLGAARIRKLFEEARKNAPAIVFIDELDAVGTRAPAAASTASRTRR